MKKICILLCLVLISTLLPVFTASAKEAAGYVTDSKTVDVGETFTVNVAVKENPGIISLRLSINYDETALSLEGVSDKKLFAGFTTPSPQVSSPYILRWADSLATSNNISDGVFVTLTFKALRQGNTSVSVSHKEARSCQGKKVSFADTEAKITVTAAEYKNENTVTPSEIRIKETAFLKNASENVVIVTEGITVETLLSNVTDGAKVIYESSQQANPSDFIQSSMRIVMTDSNGNITASKGIAVFGDIDGDGKVTATDARTALRASVGLENLSEVQKTAADTDFSKTVAAADARTILRLSVKLGETEAYMK